MCSIPGLPTPGSEVPVFITRVELQPSGSLVELWVNVDDGRKHIYEQMRKDIQSPQRKFHGSEGKPADPCLVCIGETWHRARVVSIRNETYSVFLIDQGKLHIATSEALAWGRCDLFLLPPEIEMCVLANVLPLENEWPERAVEFLKSLPGKKYKGLVQHVLMPDRVILLEIPFVSKYMCKCGVAKKIPGDEFKILALKCLQPPKGEDLEAHCIPQEPNLDVGCRQEKGHWYFYPDLLTDTFETVVVTQVNNPHSIFCKLLIFSKALKTLSEQIHQHYEEQSDFTALQPQNYGDPCAARGSSNRWHRSLLKQNMTTTGAVRVLHVDEGKTELVSVDNIKPLHGNFLRTPVVTYLCSLDGVKDTGTGWTTDQIDYLKSLLLHQTVVAKFDHYDACQGVYFVTLYAKNATCINSCFIVREGFFPPSKNGNDPSAVNGSISSFLHPSGLKQCMHEPKKVNVDVGFLNEPLPNPGNQVITDRTDEVLTCAVDHNAVKDGIQDPDHLVQSTGHLPMTFASEVQNAHDDHTFIVGSSVKVHVSCIESLQKFW